MDPIYDPEFIQKLYNNILKYEQGEIPSLNLKTNKKIKGLLQSILDECLLYDNPKSYNYRELFKLKNTNNPKKLNIL